MSREGQISDNKSLRVITGKTADWPELAKDCVAFANAQGGRLRIGIEDGAGEPPAGQRVPAELIEKVRSRIGELTVNVTIIEPHRLDALIFEDVTRYPGAAIGDIHNRIGPEIKRRQVKLALDRLCDKGKLQPEGDKRGRRYRPC